MRTLAASRAVFTAHRCLPHISSPIYAALNARHVRAYRCPVGWRCSLRYLPYTTPGNALRYAFPPTPPLRAFPAYLPPSAPTTPHYRVNGGAKHLPATGRHCRVAPPGALRCVTWRRTNHLLERYRFPRTTMGRWASWVFPHHTRATAATHSATHTHTPDVAGP